MLIGNQYLNIRCIEKALGLAYKKFSSWLPNNDVRQNFIESINEELFPKK